MIGVGTEIVYPSADKAASSSLGFHLNEVGKGGWEMINFFVMPSQDALANNFYFKRPIS